MKIKTASIVKVAYFFIAADILAAAYFQYTEDKHRTIMMLSAAMMWIVCVLIWTKDIKDKKVNGK